MSENSEVFRSVEDVLATASATIPPVQSGRLASRARLLARAHGLVHGSVTTLDPIEPEPDFSTAADLHADETPVDAEDASHRLEAVCASVVLTPTAGAALALFSEYAAADPDGALVFACLLHLAGDGEGATFWWQLAAGAELPLAAYCLYLDHSRRGEYSDARLWARRLTATADLHARAGDSPLPPPRLRHALVNVSRWTRQHEHEDLGAIPLARPDLAREIFILAPQPHQPGPGSWMVPFPATAPTPAARLPQARDRADGPGAHPAHSNDTTCTQAAYQAHAPGASTAFSPMALRHTTLTALAQQVPSAPHVPHQWAASLKVLDVLHAVRGARQPLAAGQIAAACHVDPSPLTPLLNWLCRHQLLHRLDDGGYTPGPLFAVAPAGDPVLRHDALARLLDHLRDSTGAAIYISRYIEGEVVVQSYSASHTAPAINQWVDLKEAAHASANGKSLMAQLPFDLRMDHLARHRPLRLTPRTITSPAALFRVLDGHGSQASQFDLLEYSECEVCAAIPIILDGQPASIALSLPRADLPRLIEAAGILSNRSGLILLTLLASLPAGSEPTPGELQRVGDRADEQTTEPTNDTGNTEVLRRRPSGLLLPPGRLTPVPAAGLAYFSAGNW
ncbi:IclR family transcriptional regulator C-terminal domain-containing protein [Streptomyces sp. NPDC057540]|uniref:IclR family transcriptional regulator domain-containing protein n=1 Tax=Streptomyces sp. NPDC057540 TaxID=3346160 RepID=UPI0036937A19